jgi:uncharacterized protein with ParB-like and HNH nuclease domain
MASEELHYDAVVIGSGQSGDDVDLHNLYDGINKSFIVDISLEGDKDNPQLIFGSLNSTGFELSQADRIRNYVLMGLLDNNSVGYATKACRRY